jgi:hypothetical protein
MLVDSKTRERFRYVISETCSSQPNIDRKLIDFTSVSGVCVWEPRLLMAVQDTLNSMSAFLEPFKSAKKPKHNDLRVRFCC